MAKSMSVTEYQVPTWDSIKATGQTIPRIRLAQLPTPVHPIQLDVNGVSLSVKRDDLTGMLLSGNKIRKLEFLLGDALRKGYDCVITIGGVQSNHCRATAWACAQLNIPCYLILRSDTPADELQSDGNLLLDRISNAHIRVVTVANYRRLGPQKCIEQFQAKLGEEGKRAYAIPMGGSDGVGLWGYIEAFREIQRNAVSPFDHIFVAMGSGGTAAGLGLAALLEKSATKIHGVCVCDDKSYFEQEINRMLSHFGIRMSVHAADIVDIIEGYQGGGYGINNDAEIASLVDIARQHGLCLDPTYSLKAFIGMRQELHKEAFKGSRVLFIHTGGAFGLFAGEKNSMLNSDLQGEGRCDLKNWTPEI